MIALFHNIRKSLLQSGQARRYLLYAIGEIALVVIGILIALKINTWNIDRLNSIEEERILIAVVQKVDFNRFQHSRGSSYYTEVVDAAERILLKILNDKTVLIPEEMATDLHFLTKRFLMGANNATHLYDELIGSGQLGLISSHEIRQRITTLKVNLELLAAYEILQTEFVDNQLIPYLNKHVDRISISAIGSKSDPSRYDALINIEFATKVKKDYASSFQNLLEDQEFANMLLELVKKTKQLLPIYGRIEEDLNMIDSLIKLESS